MVWIWTYSYLFIYLFNAILLFALWMTSAKETQKLTPEIKVPETMYTRCIISSKDAAGFNKFDENLPTLHFTNNVLIICQWPLFIGKQNFTEDLTINIIRTNPTTMVPQNNAKKEIVCSVLRVVPTPMMPLRVRENNISA